MKQFTDDVNGIIISGNYGQCCVTYQGRQQGSTCYPETIEQAQFMCQSILDEIKKDSVNDFIFKTIYPDVDGWKFNFNGI